MTEWNNSCCNLCASMIDVVNSCIDYVFGLAKPKYEYKKNVMMFWSGSKGISTNPPYQVSLTTNSQFPKSHTCFNQLELPISLTSKEDLFNKFMNMFLFNQHRAFGDR